MRQAHKTIELPLPDDVTDIASLRRMLVRDLAPTETIVSIMLDATDEEVTDAMMQQWRTRSQPSTESLTLMVDDAAADVIDVDTLVAQHLLKTVAAARLMGADCIISGIRPQIAQTIVHLGVDLSEVTTKATLADAFMIALQRTGASVTKSAVSQLKG